MELSSSRIDRENQDLTKFLSLFDAHEPFNFEEPLLNILFRGLVASAEDGVTCDDADKIGEEI